MLYHNAVKLDNFNSNLSSKIIIICTFMLYAIGITLLYSAAGGSFYPWAIKQIYIIICFIPLILVIRHINTSLIYQYAYHIYFFFLLLLFCAEILGYYAMGAQRWLRFGVINIQPSEFMKIAVIIVLASNFHNMHSIQVIKFKYLLIPMIFTLIPVLLILKQPNLGTAIITLSIAASIFWASGVRKIFFIIPIVSGIASLPIIWQLLHSYQKKRILTFLNPESDLLGAGYNIMQSKIAIGSGGIYGKGLLNGTQNQLSFLPEKHTDFIFTLLAEEMGFIGCIVVFILYIAILFYCYYISISVKHQFGRLVICGISTMIFTHVFINTGMISGILPAVGIPLPLLSYGGSNLAVTLLGIALILNVQKHAGTSLIKEI